MPQLRELLSEDIKKELAKLRDKLKKKEQDGNKGDEVATKRNTA